MVNIHFLPHKISLKQILLIHLLKILYLKSDNKLFHLQSKENHLINFKLEQGHLKLTSGKQLRFRLKIQDLSDQIIQRFS
jgi:hypothetical protein